MGKTFKDRKSRNKERRLRRLNRDRKLVRSAEMVRLYEGAGR